MKFLIKIMIVEQIGHDQNGVPSRYLVKQSKLRGKISRVKVICKARN